MNLKLPSGLIAPALVVLAVAATLVGCGRTPVAPNSTSAVDPGAALGKVNGARLTVDDYRQQAFYFNPLSRLQADRPAERLQAMVESELLWQEAQKRKILDRPEVRRQFQQIVINELVREAVLPKAATATVTEKEAQDYYQANLSRYYTPGSVRVAHILLAGPDKAVARTEAERILKDPLIQQPGGFAKLVTQHSADTATGIYGGDLGFLVVPDARAGKSTLEPWQTKVVETANKLSGIGAVSPEVVETEKGFHLVKLTGRQAPTEYSFAQVRDKITRQLSTESQARAYRAYVEELKAQAKVEVHPEELPKLVNSGIPGAELLRREHEKAAQDLARQELPAREIPREQAVTWTPGSARSQTVEQPAGAEPRAKIVSVVGAQRNVMAPNTIRLMAAATPVEPTRPSGTIHVEKRDLLPGTPAPQPAK